MLLLADEPPAEDFPFLPFEPAALPDAPCDVTKDVKVLIRSVIVSNSRRDEMNMKQKKTWMCVCARESDVERMNENDGGNVGGVYALPSSLPFFLSFLLPIESNRT